VLHPGQPQQIVHCSEYSYARKNQVDINTSKQKKILKDEHHLQILKVGFVLSFVHHYMYALSQFACVD